MASGTRDPMASGDGCCCGGGGRFNLEYAGETGELKDFVHRRGKGGEGRLAAGGLELLRGGKKHAKADAAGVGELAAVEDELARPGGEQRFDSLLEWGL